MSSSPPTQNPQQLRKLKRKEQSIRDKEAELRRETAKALDPFSEYRSFITSLKQTGSADGNIKTPNALTDFAIEHLTAMALLRGGQPIMSDLTEFVKRIMRKIKPCCSTTCVALLYLDRFWRIVPKITNSFTPLKGMPSYSVNGQLSPDASHRFAKAEFAIAVILADKYLFDCSMSNSEWAKITGFSLQEINLFERQFLAHFDYNIQFTERGFEEFVAFIEVSLAVRRHSTEAFNWFPLTYTDICILNTPLSDEYSHTLKISQKPLESSVLFFKLMLMCCFTYCAVMVSFGFTIRNFQQFQTLAHPEPELAAKKLGIILPPEHHPLWKFPFPALLIVDSAQLESTHRPLVVSGSKGGGSTSGGGADGLERVPSEF